MNNEYVSNNLYNINTVTQINTNNLITLSIVNNLFRQVALGTMTTMTCKLQWVC